MKQCVHAWERQHRTGRQPQSMKVRLQLT